MFIFLVSLFALGLSALKLGAFVSTLGGETSVRGIERIGPTETGKLLTLNPRRLLS